MDGSLRSIIDGAGVSSETSDNPMRAAAGRRGHQGRSLRLLHVACKDEATSMAGVGGQEGNTDLIAASSSLMEAPCLRALHRRAVRRSRKELRCCERGTLLGSHMHDLQGCHASSIEVGGAQEEV